jgi:hypothetical protein
MRETANDHEIWPIMAMSVLWKYVLLPGRSTFFKTILDEDKDVRKRGFRQSQRPRSRAKTAP